MISYILERRLETGMQVDSQRETQEEDGISSKWSQPEIQQRLRSWTEQNRYR